jgi:cytochrome c oxidase subunit 2
MSGTTTVTTFVRGAVAIVGKAFVSVFLHSGASVRSTSGKERKVRRFGPTLLLALPFLVALVPEAVDSTRTIDVTVSRSAFSPERIEVRVGERIRLNVVSVDGTHGFQAKALGLNATIPASGRTVTFELTPREVGTFAINCSEYCGRGHRSMQASLIVTPQIAIEKRAAVTCFNSTSTTAREPRSANSRVVASRTVSTSASISPGNSSERISKGSTA